MKQGKPGDDNCAQNGCWQTTDIREGNVKLTNKAPRHEDGWGSRDTAPPFLIPALDDELSASRPDRLIPGERDSAAMG
jgi:hypothetical protein